MGLAGMGLGQLVCGVLWVWSRHDTICDEAVVLPLNGWGGWITCWQECLVCLHRHYPSLP